MNPYSRRQEKLEKRLEEYYDLLDQYQSQLLHTTDPIKRNELKGQEEWVNQRIEELDAELLELQKKISMMQAAQAVAAVETGASLVESAIEKHYNDLLELLKRGRVVPILGANVNIFGRPPQAVWQPSSDFAPTNNELAQYLARSFEYPTNSPIELPGVSQFVSVKHRPGPLTDSLRQIYEADYKPNRIHEFFARLPAFLRSKLSNPRYPIFVTTSYDNLLEKAFQKANEPYDLLSYVADGEHRNKFVHWAPGSEDFIPIDDPSNYRQLQPDQRAIILKMNRVPDRTNTGQDRYSITQDHFIKYMARSEVSKLIPAKLMEQLRGGSLLFMGYPIQDWTVRVMLNRIWSDREHRTNDYPSWAIEADPQPLNNDYWDQWDVKVIQATTEEYLDGLTEKLKALPAIEVAL